MNTFTKQELISPKINIVFLPPRIQYRNVRPSLSMIIGLIERKLSKTPECELTKWMMTVVWARMSSDWNIRTSNPSLSPLSFGK